MKDFMRILPLNHVSVCKNRSVLQSFKAGHINSTSRLCKEDPANKQEIWEILVSIGQYLAT